MGIEVKKMPNFLEIFFILNGRLIQFHIREKISHGIGFNPYLVNVEIKFYKPQWFYYISRSLEHPVLFGNSNDFVKTQKLKN